VPAPIDYQRPGTRRPVKVGWWVFAAVVWGFVALMLALFVWLELKP
jgi:hypothetical protein